MKILEVKRRDCNRKRDQLQTASMDENGKLFRDVKEEELKTEKVGGFGRAKNAIGSGTNKVGKAISSRVGSSSKPLNEAGNTAPQSSDYKSGDEEQKPANDKRLDHNTPPSGESSTGSNPSHTNNSTTYPNTAQGNLAKAQQNLAELKAMSPLDSAKNAIKLMAGTSVNPDSAEYKSFASKVDHNIPMPRLTVRKRGHAPREGALFALQKNLFDYPHRSNHNRCNNSACYPDQHCSIKQNFTSNRLTWLKRMFFRSFKMK